MACYKVIVKTANGGAAFAYHSQLAAYAAAEKLFQEYDEVKVVAVRDDA